MKVLVAGYACSPVGGSEPGVGWAAVLRIARSHNVWVLTDIHNKKGWEIGREEGKIPDNVKVRFIRDRSACSANRLIAHAQSWFNYRSFNAKVLQAAEEWHKEIGFDLCHQVTIAAWRMPSPLCQLQIPFIWGPIGGAGHIPKAFRGMLSLSSKLFEKARDLQTFIALKSKNFHVCMKKTAVVFAANEETEILLKPFRGALPMYRLPIASVSDQKRERFARRISSYDPEEPLRLFAGGNIEGRKGVSLALKALAKVAKSGFSFHYTVAGGGPEVPALRELCKKLGLNDSVTFHPGYRGDDYIEALHRSDVYFLPSFRESTPVTLIEAYLAGCYPVVADTSAQGEIVRICGGVAVPVETPSQLIDGLADAVEWCANHRAELKELTPGFIRQISENFSSENYDKTVANAYLVATKSKV